MGGEMGVRAFGTIRAVELAARSRDALDAALVGDAELWLAEIADEAVLLGAFQRGVEALSARQLGRRGSGGAAAAVGPGSLYVGLSLSNPGSLVACDASRLINRHVRPLLRALTKAGHEARYFGRDWISVHGSPAALAGFAHDARTGRALFEAFVAVRTPFAPAGRASFLGREPAALESISGRTVYEHRLGEMIAETYRDAYGRDLRTLDTGAAPEPDDPQALRADPPWSATVEEALGRIGAGRNAHGVMRLGGELMVSRNAVARVEAGMAQGEDVDRLVHEAFGAPGVATLGIRSLASVCDVLRRA